MQEIAEQKHCCCLGSYGCKGYDTYGPFGLIGGINKNHPDDQEIQGDRDSCFLVAAPEIIHISLLNQLCRLC